MLQLPSQFAGSWGNLDHVLRKTAIAAVAGVGLLLAATQSQAVVIHSGIVNLDIPVTTNGLYLNVVTGANSGTPVPGWDINLWSSLGLGFFNPAAPVGGAYVLSAATTAANLLPGTSVDVGSIFGSGASNNTAQWNLNSSDNLFGFRFLNESNGQVHYGWGRLSLLGTVNTTGRALVEYAYEDVAGAAILAGAVPEPATYAMMALGIAGLLLARRHKRPEGT